VRTRRGAYLQIFGSRLLIAIRFRGLSAKYLRGDGDGFRRPETASPARPAAPRQGPHGRRGRHGALPGPSDRGCCRRGARGVELVEREAAIVVGEDLEYILRHGLMVAVRPSGSGRCAAPWRAASPRRPLPSAPERGTTRQTLLPSHRSA
jgi:hypothetical protein